MMRWLLVVLLLLLATPSQAARINIIGFESGSLDPEPWTYSGTVSISSTTVRTGGYSLRVNPTTTATGLYRVGCFTSAGGRDVACSVATLYTRFYFRYATKPASGSEILYQSRTSADGVKFSLRLNSSGNLLAYDSAGSLLATGSTALSQDTWYRIEVRVETGASVGWEAKLNGTSEISGTGANLGTSNNGRLFLGKTTDVSGQSIDFFYDDFSLDDAEYPGEGKIVRLVPNANGSTMQWSTGTGSSNYLEVDDVPVGVGSYVKNTGAANEVALFDLTDSATAGISGTIRAVRPLLLARLDATGTSAFSLRTRSGTTNTDLATVALTTGGAYISTTYATDPDTAGAWSTSAIDALEVGGIETAAVSTRLQDVHVYVEYTEAVASASGSLMLMGVGQ